MKKIILSFGFLALSALSLFSQSHEMAVGLRGGLSIPKIRAIGDNPMSQGYESRVLGGGGLFFEYSFSPAFSIRPGIEFSAQGGNRDGMQAIPARMFKDFPIPSQIQSQLPQYLYANFDSQTSFNYLMIPVLAQYGLNLGKTSPFRVYINAGPFISFLLSADQKTSGNSQIYLDKEGNVSLDQALQQYQIPITVGERSFDRDESIKSQTESINWGICGNIGLAYQTGKHRIFIEGGGNYGFQKLQKDSANGENCIGVGTVMLGYAYRLK